MKIMHVSTVGSHPCFSELMEQQRKSHEILFARIEFSEDGSRQDKYEIEQCPSEDELIIKNIKKTFDQGYDPELAVLFNRIFRRYRPDIVHVQVFSGLSLLPILNSASSFGIRKILTLHDHSLFCVKGVCHDDRICDITSLDTCR